MKKKRRWGIPIVVNIEATVYCIGTLADAKRKARKLAKEGLDLDTLNDVGGDDVDTAETTYVFPDRIKDCGEP